MTTIFSSTRFRFLRGAAPIGILAAAAACLLAGQPSAQARARFSSASTATDSTRVQPSLVPMTNRSILMLLPVRVGENWKATPQFTSAFLRNSDATVRRFLSASGRYSLLEVRRFNPVLMRAVQDGVATSDDLNTLLSRPTTPNASTILSKLTFNVAPLQAFKEPARIASFVLDNMTMNDNSLSVKLTGRLYSADGQTVLRSLSATTTVPSSPPDGAVSAAATSAVTVAANRIVSEFTRVPSETERVTGEQPLVIARTGTTPVLKATTDTTATMQNGIVLPGKPIKGSSSHSSGLPPSTGGNSVPDLNQITNTGTSTVVEVPPAEKFPLFVTPDSSSPTNETPRETSTTDTTGKPTVANGESGTTMPSTESTDETQATTDTTGTNVAESTPEMSDSTNNTPPIENSDSATTNSSPAGGLSTGGVTSDGASFSGTVGASSTDTHANVPPGINDDLDLAFEY